MTTRLTVLAAMIAMSFHAQSQMNVSVATGVGWTKNIKRAAIQWDVSYASNFGNIYAGYANMISRRSDAGCLFYLKIGKTLQATERLSLAPNFGYGYLLISNDVKGLNKQGIVYGGEVAYEVNEQVRVIASGNFTNSINFLNLGFRFYIVRSDR
jgi:hypothetical protein